MKLSSPGILFVGRFFFKDLIYLERESTQAGGGVEGEGDRESQASSMLSAEPNPGLGPITLRSSPELKSRDA